MLLAGISTHKVNPNQYIRLIPIQSGANIFELKNTLGMNRLFEIERIIIKIYVVKNLFIIILLLVMSGCSDNPISITTKLSPPRYSWTVDTLEGYGYEIVPFDTNSYFILTYADLLNKNKNGVQTSYSLDFLGTSMDGDGESNLMIGGAIEYSSENYFPILKKFNNGVLTEIYRGLTHSDHHY
ncbi:MAG: hypothetical protein ACOYN6_16295, partial [Ignavibacteria bacterium]